MPRRPPRAGMQGRTYQTDRPQGIRLGVGTGQISSRGVACDPGRERPVLWRGRRPPRSAPTDSQTCVRDTDDHGLPHRGHGRRRVLSSSGRPAPACRVPACRRRVPAAATPACRDRQHQVLAQLRSRRRQRRAGPGCGRLRPAAGGRTGAELDGSRCAAAARYGPSCSADGAGGRLGGTPPLLALREMCRFRASEALRWAPKRVSWWYGVVAVYRERRGILLGRGWSVVEVYQ